MDTHKRKLVVLGAGVSGLTTALRLSTHAGLCITVLAKHMPGDHDIEYCSPWAGADYMPVSKPNTNARIYETHTWPELQRLALHHPEAGIHFQDSVRYVRNSDLADGWTLEQELRQDDWLGDLMPEFRRLQVSELPPGFHGGYFTKSVCVNTAIYLPWLVGQCVKRGVVFRRADVSHVAEATTLHHSGVAADMVINCTGLSARTLGGVQDLTVYPVRGQVVVVRNAAHGLMPTTTAGEDGPNDESTYFMERAVGGGTVLGGCRQTHNWSSAVDEALSKRIMQRCIALCPKLVGPGQGIEGLSVIRHAVGLRPEREDGIRIERESIVANDSDGRTTVEVVHNYGHGGYGYQTSYGCAMAVECLVLEGVGGEAGLCTSLRPSSETGRLANDQMIKV